MADDTAAVVRGPKIAARGPTRGRWGGRGLGFRRGRSRTGQGNPGARALRALHRERPANLEAWRCFAGGRGGRRRRLVFRWALGGWRGRCRKRFYLKLEFGFRLRRACEIAGNKRRGELERRKEAAKSSPARRSARLRRARPRQRASHQRKCCLFLWPEFPPRPRAQRAAANRAPAARSRRAAKRVVPGWARLRKKPFPARGAAEKKPPRARPKEGGARPAPAVSRPSGGAAEASPTSPGPGPRHAAARRGPGPRTRPGNARSGAGARPDRTGARPDFPRAFP